MKENVMKKLILAAALVLPALAQAQNLDRWDSKNDVIRAVNNAGRYQCGTTAAVSYTIPTGALYVRFDPSLGHYVCAENSAQPVCSPGRPTTGSGTTAWERLNVARRMVDLNNGSSMRPDRLWVQAEVSTDCIYWHYNAGTLTDQ